ncbi:MAG: ATP synthase F1 subunit delta [Candidatus Brocadiales bacterium]
MIEKAVATGYIQALFEVARARGLFHETEKDLEKVAQLLRENHELKKILLCPAIPRERKIKLLDSLLAPHLNPFVINFLRLIVDKRREEMLNFILEGYKPIADLVGGVARAVVQTVVPLTEERFAILRDTLERLSGKKVEVRTELKPEILGGVVITIGNKVIDGSVRSRLENLRKRLMERKAA